MKGKTEAVPQQLRRKLERENRSIRSENWAAKGNGKVNNGIFGSASVISHLPARGSAITSDDRWTTTLEFRLA